MRAMAYTPATMQTPGIILENTSFSHNKSSIDKYVKMMIDTSMQTKTRSIREIIFDSFSNNSNLIKSKRIEAYDFSSLMTSL